MTLLDQIRANIRFFKDRAKAHRAQGATHLADLCAKYEAEWREREKQQLSKGAKKSTGSGTISLAPDRGSSIL